MALLLVIPHLLPRYSVLVLSYGLALAIGCLGLNLLFGYTGLLSLGHAAYFGVGAYAVVPGGTGRFLGPVVGAVALTALREVASRFTLYRGAVLGLLLIAVVLACPAGLAGRPSGLAIRGWWFPRR